MTHRPKNPKSTFGIPLARITLRRRKRPIRAQDLREVVGLLDHPQFRADTMAIHAALLPRPEGAMPRTKEEINQRGGLIFRFGFEEARRREWFHAPSTPYGQAILSGMVPPFYKRWGVFPPLGVDLQDPAESRQGERGAYILGTGTWGLIPVYPWTTEAEVQAARRRIKERIKEKAQNVHQDTRAERRRMQVAGWLAIHSDARGQPIPRALIAQTVWGRKTGLRRPTQAQAIAKLSEDREAELLRSFRAKGLSDGEAERRVYRRARGSEANAVAQVRQARRRYSQSVEASLARLDHPEEGDPLAFALTMALRAAFVSRDSTQVHRWLTSLFQGLVTARLA
ncbi:MAG: hypothetical protein A3G35_11000 [candidate division NC10 bacterium RIFCSPLOWO2_12_FULL_66_18]|nr:MAG: hypothetical protein A3G35_11000 [candidate division NC10 bacterium RIFCSPLOWO2_12_FULL_66_18]